MGQKTSNKSDFIDIFIMYYVSLQSYKYTWCKIYGIKNNLNTLWLIHSLYDQKQAKHKKPQNY